jgi:hypothetical protein
VFRDRLENEVKQTVNVTKIDTIELMLASSPSFFKRVTQLLFFVPITLTLAIEEPLITIFEQPRGSEF